MGKTETPLCSFCNIDEETLEHLFWKYTYTSTFILNVKMKSLQFYMITNADWKWDITSKPDFSKNSNREL